MIADIVAISAERCCRLEPGGWLTVCERVPELDNTPASELLRPGAPELFGNLRYARTAAGIVRLEEVHTGHGASALSEAEMRLCSASSFEQGVAGGSASEEQIEACLADAGWTWSRRESAWVVPATTARPVEVCIEPIPSGALARATLADLVGVSDEGREALADFLLHAHSGLRFARCVMTETLAQVTSLAHTNHLESDLPNSLGSILAACRFLLREVHALLKPDVAREFCRCTRQPLTQP